MRQKDNYDIIIENITKEWMISMRGEILKEKWEIPKYSKSEINKAGKTITDSNSSQNDRAFALTILNNWRSSHAYPLQVISSNLRLRNPDAIVVQRLKRLNSITGKLERFNEMSLYRMQDLGGCRVILDTIDQVYESLNKYKSSRIRHILKKEYDYIQNPKSSGYRSYHMVYQFQSDKKETYNKNILIEIQFRTKLQHIWATAVEMIGIYTKSNLKSSQGNEDILRFFTLTSSIFAKMENMPICPNTPDDYDLLISELKQIDKKTNIIPMLKALSTVINHVNSNEQLKKNSYYVLQLDYKTSTLKVHSFSKNKIELATNVYNKLEGLNNPYLDIVLVSAASFD